jgi:hypothetical protein
MRRVSVLAGVALLLGVSPASASQLIDRSAVNVRLAVSSDGQALITYTVAGQAKHVLAWGAVNARTPNPSVRQVAFHVDYSGGRGAWRTFKNACRPLPAVVPFQVAACQAPDDSYWALQSWQRELPDYGVKPTAQQAAFELRLSHWTGGLAGLSVSTGWAYKRYDELFGQLVYGGQPVYGYKATPAGVPLDTYGRNLYVDTYGSAYGPGWVRENSFLTHLPNGTFCYGFYPHGSHPVGKGQRYRVTVIGPGVTPDVSWEGNAPGPYDPAKATTQVSVQRSLMARDPSCTPHP